MIASSADKDKNRLDTGTLGWSDIHNQADYTAEHSGGSLSTGGPVGKDLLTNMAGGMLSGANNSGHAEGTTKSAVSEGAIIIRAPNKQQQDVAQLNRDTAHANDGSINPIFNKEREQNRLKQAQLIGEIGSQAMDVIRTQGDIAGLKAQKEPGALAQAKEQLEKSGKPFSEAEVVQRAYNNAMAQYGTGSDLQKAAQAVTGALTALAGNNLAGALASGASPYLATEIKKRLGEDNKAANAMAHAVLGAVTAQLNNQSAMAGGLGASAGELAAQFIVEKLFPGKKTGDLSEVQKQQVSALSQLAAGLAGGLATGDTGGAVTAAQAGKNAVENNALGKCSPLTCKAIVDPLEGGGGVIGGGGRGGGGGSSTKPVSTAKEPVRFIEGITVKDIKTGQTFSGTVDLKPTLDRIASGGMHPHRNDGSVFKNLPDRTTGKSDLPIQPTGYYKEYIHPTPNISGPGPQRVIVGQNGEAYYTNDHYTTFIKIR